MMYSWIVRLVVLIPFAQLIFRPVETTTAKGTVYKYAAHYWPFDYSTGIRDQVTASDASLFGDGGIRLTGTGNGHLSLNLWQSAIRLGEYRTQCITSLSNCTSGLSLAFWIKLSGLERFRTFKEGSQVPLLAFISKNDFRNIECTANKKQGQTFIMLNIFDGSHHWQSMFPPHNEAWNHVMLVFSPSQGLNVYVNGIKAIEVVKQRRISPSASYVNLMVGSIRGIENFKGMQLGFDDLAIWYKNIKLEHVERIYLDSFGKVMQLNCEVSKDWLKINWKTSSDLYRHIVAYNVSVHSKNDSFWYKVSSNNTSTTTRIFHINSTYTVKVNGILKNRMQLNATTSKCGAALSTDPPIKAFAISSSAIRVLWKIRNGSQIPIAYFVSYAFKGIDKTHSLYYVPGGLNHTINDLQINTEYMIGVTGMYQKGGGTKSFKIAVRTFKLEKLPTHPVDSIRIDKITWKSFVVTWNAPLNASIYNLVYRLSVKPSKGQIFIMTTSINQTKIDNLKQNTTYFINIEAGSPKLGFGPHLNAVIAVKTKVKFPQVEGITTTRTGWNFIKLKWKSSELKQIKFYNIKYHSEFERNSISVQLNSSKSEEQKKSRSILLNSSRHEIMLHNLLQLTSYYITIVAGDGRSFGAPQKKPLFATTTDRNECQDSIHDCHRNASCLNSDGSFSCQCHEGFMGDGRHCRVIASTLPDDQYCKQEMARRMLWNRTFQGQTQLHKCPLGSTGIAKRTCIQTENGPVIWMPPDLSGCVSRWIKVFKTKVKSHEESSSLLISSLFEEYSSQTNVVGGDIDGVVSIMNYLTDMSYNEVKSSSDKSGKSEVNDVKNLANNVVNITNKLLSEQTLTVWNDLPKENKRESAGNILRTMNSLASVFEASSQHRSDKIETIVVSSPNAIIEMQPIQGKTSLSFPKSNHNSESNFMDSTVTLPMEVLNITENENRNKSSLASFYIVRNIENLLGTGRSPAYLRPGSSKLEQSSQNGSFINSGIVSASVFPATHRVFKKPVVITQTLKEVGKGSKPACVYWQWSSSNVGHWSSQGCDVYSSNESHVVCHCYHLTNFAVLMSVTDVSFEQKWEHRFALKIITTVCLVISLISLVLSFITFCTVSVLSSVRNTVHKNLVVALFCAELLFIFGIERTKYMVLCAVISAMLHYLFLVAFMLMGLEGFILYLMLIRVYQSMKGGYGKVKFIIACWLIPILVVGLTALVDYKGYGTNYYCWLTTEDGFIWSFVGPVIFLITANIGFLIMALRVMSQKSQKRDELSDELWYWFKCCCMLISLLGITWILGIFYLNDETTFLAYIFSILNALQGLAIFVFHCLLDSRVRNAYSEFFCFGNSEYSFMRSLSISRTKSLSIGSSRNEKSRARRDSDGNSRCRKQSQSQSQSVEKEELFTAEQQKENSQTESRPVISLSMVKETLRELKAIQVEKQEVQIDFAMEEEDPSQYKAVSPKLLWKTMFDQDDLKQTKL